VSESAVAITTSSLTLLGALSGYFLAGLNDERRDKRAAAREAVGRAAAFAERLEEDRHTFQRDTLLELQDELQRMARINAKTIMFDKRQLRDQGKLTQLPEDLSQEDFINGTAVRRLTSRVLDSAMRQQVEQFQEYCAQISAEVPVFLKDEPPGIAIPRLEGYLKEMGDRYISCHAALGVLIRAELDRRYLADPI
jgi:hypothetical protein